MWKFGFVVVFLSLGVSGQEQFLREVTNPSGPSQVFLRGGSLNSNGNGDELQQIQPLSDQAVEERYVVTDDPVQAVPFQSPQETPIPEDGGEGNPFTNGENGFGLRLSQQAPISPPRQVQQVQSAQPPPQPQPQQPQPQLFQNGAPVFQQVQQPVEIDQPAPIIHQTEISLPQLPPGQQYVDVYGRPINLEGQQSPQVLQQAAPPTAPPQPPAAPQIQTLPPPQQQVLVDQYGRQLTSIGPIENQSHFLPQHLFQPAQVLQPAPVPVVAHAPVQHLVQQAPVALPVLKQKLSPLTLQTYAVPAVRKVGNLVIPYAQKVQFAKRLNEDVVFHPTVPAPAVVKSRHRTVFSPTKILTPTVQEVHHVEPVLQEVHALPAPVVNLSYPAAPQLEIHHQVQAPGQVLVQHPEQIALAQQPQQLVHFAEQHPQLLHHPQQLLHHPQQLLHHPQQLVHFEGQHPQILHHPQQLVQVGHHLTPTVPLASPFVEHHIHHQPQAVHVEKHLVHAAPAPVVVKKVKQVIEKTIVPEVTLIHQPILPKVLFQRHIFNVKHGSEPIIYQDLCTVYPYQKNLRACVLKKATLPELHHPDVRTINVEYQQQTDQSKIAAGSPILAPAQPSVTVAKALPQNIQDTIRRESARIKAAATKNSEVTATTADAAVASSVQPDAAESRDSSSRGKSRRKKNKGSTSRQTTTTERPFKLA